VRQFIGENFDCIISELNTAPLLLVCADDSHFTSPALSVIQQPEQLCQDAARLSRDFNPLDAFAHIRNSHFNRVS